MNFSNAKHRNYTLTIGTQQDMIGVEVENR